MPLSQFALAAAKRLYRDRGFAQSLWFDEYTSEPVVARQFIV